MKSMNVKLDSIEKVRKFISIITMYDGEFDLASNRYIVDAKSIMGIFSLDLAQALRLDIQSEECFDKLSEELKDLKV